MSVANFGWGGREARILGRGINWLDIAPRDLIEVSDKVFSGIREKYVIHGPGFVAKKRIDPKFGGTEVYVELKTEHVARLRPGEWLDTSIIDAFTLMLNRYEAQGEINAPPRICMMTQRQNHGNTPHAFAPGLKPKYAGLVCNTDRTGPGVHWILYWGTFDHAARTVDLVCYDSLADRRGRHNSSRDKNIMELFAACISQELSSEPYKVAGGAVKDGPCPQQPNGCDCGVYALAFAFSLAANPETAPTFPFRKSGADAGERARRALAYRLARNCEEEPGTCT